MPRARFICPDGIEIGIRACLDKCRMGGRCVSKPTLLLMSRKRQWTGKISATQALNGTRMEYLKIREEYAEAPVSLAFALLGTLHHSRLEGVSPADALIEERLEDELGHGTFDFYDPDEEALWSYKTAGAYKVNRALGKRKEMVDDPDAPPYKSGPRKGQPRQKVVWFMGTPDIFEWQMQDSRYAWMLTDAGFPVQRIYLQVTVRDFTAQTARQYGLDRQIYVIPLDIFAREVVEEFYRAKQGALKAFLAQGVLPPPCDPRERWCDDGVNDFETPGRRCVSFCPVWKWCDLGIRAHEEPKPEEEEGTA